MAKFEFEGVETWNVIYTVYAEDRDAAVVLMDNGNYDKREMNECDQWEYFADSGVEIQK